ncbi:hypothetical protein MUK42_13226 [Musa troglodytarum]|uniref:Uncharacterized protein n=1 Tax=Musa troglodytarum TaxID=320322 RepID=A0A9E7GUD6_9LILI|nr:hypothetical protein MUK42_13226 [Musa troglodytarum]
MSYSVRRSTADLMVRRCRSSIMPDFIFWRLLSSIHGLMRFRRLWLLIYVFEEVTGEYKILAADCRTLGFVQSFGVREWSGISL